jgi:hypothetical protein
LLVQPDGKGGGAWHITYLPDQSQVMVATPSNFISSLSTTMTFENGVLTGSEDTGDGTVLPKAVIGVIEKLLPFVLAPNVVAAPPGSVPQPAIYRIIVTDRAVELRGKSSATSDTFVHALR